MKEQILPDLPVIGRLIVSSRDGKTISSITVTRKKPSTVLEPLFRRCFDEIERFLSGNSDQIDLPLDFSGLTPFQLKVLKEMKKIPYGKVLTYKELAQRVGTKGYQAIGTACGKNPFMLIYPCHRVVGSNDLGGFAHGLKMKQEILNIESNNSRY